MAGASLPARLYEAQEHTCFGWSQVHLFRVTGLTKTKSKPCRRLGAGVLRDLKQDDGVNARPAEAKLFDE